MRLTSIVRLFVNTYIYAYIHSYIHNTIHNTKKFESMTQFSQLSPLVIVHVCFSQHDLNKFKTGLQTVAKPLGTGYTSSSAPVKIT